MLAGISRIEINLHTGDPSMLPYSTNLVLTLGNMTSLNVADKKGVLSWPNPTPEQLFFFREQPPPSATSVSTTRRNRLDSALRFERAGSAPLGRLSGELRSEILNLTPNADEPFGIQFDELTWRRFLPQLKPLGLNFRLNGCDLDAAYGPFLDHLSAVSASVPRTIAVVNRRCCCFVAETFGFRFPPASAVPPTVVGEDVSLLAAYRKQPGEQPVPGLTKHRTPLPNLFAAVANDGGHSHLMAQGTADLVIDACSAVWTGVAAVELSRAARRKVLDFYQRNSMTSYCLALSYRPVTSSFMKQLPSGYLECPQRLPVDPLRNSFDLSKQPYLSLSVDSVLDEGSEVDGDSFSQEKVLSHHIFLGMLTLQYQAKPEVVKLVENLEKACIRFVYFSRENELRSRLFAEKIGLEAGWNCHISLANEGVC